MNSKLISWLPLLFIAFQAQSQTIYSFPMALEWKDEVWVEAEQEPPLLLLDFAGADRWPNDPAFPVYRLHYPLPGPGEISLTYTDEQWEVWPGQKPDPSILDRLPQSNTYQVWTASDRGTYSANGFVLPLKRAGSSWYRMISCTITLKFTPQIGQNVSLRGGDTEESILHTGTIYKIAVSEDGMYQLSYDYLKNTLKMPVDDIDPRRIHLYGNGGAMLPRANAAPRPDDLVENALFIQGEADGVFHPSDFILFYAHGPHPVVYDSVSNRLSRPTHLYDTKSYYFLKVESIDGLRVETQPSLDETNSVQSNGYDVVQRMEDELVNLLDDFVSAQGSGSRWFGDKFSSALKSVDYSNRFDLTHWLPGTPVLVRGAFVSRSDLSNRFTLNSGSASLQTGTMNGTLLGEIESLYATNGNFSGSFLPSASPFPLQITYTANGTNATGWLDFVEVQMRKSLTFASKPLRFCDLEQIGQDKVTYSLSNTPAATRIWDISNPLMPKNQQYIQQGNQSKFTNEALSLHTYIAFDLQGSFYTPEFIGITPNQNLHGILEADMLLVYHPEFQDAALRLTDHRRSFSNLAVIPVPIDQIYNEFSSGSKDPMAIRDLARMVYMRDSQFHYLLLLGDGSFDTRNIKKLTKDLDFIPVFETDESLDPINSFPTDDLYALMEEHEGGQLTGQSIDIAIGRLPVESALEANQLIEKIIHYDLAPATFGDWRLRTLFMADDEDNNLHLNDADALAESTQAWNEDLNLDKVYLDAYKQLATPGGQRYPDGNKAFNNGIYRGALLVNYLGHGGTSGWTQERVLQIEDILSWTNSNRLPLFLTATCTFAAFDNPGVKSGGEHVLLNPNGGGIALYSTVRPVYATQNKDLASKTLQELFLDTNPWEQPIGEILRRAKNKRGNGLNDRKFLLLGDPSQLLAYPKYRVATTHINGKVVNHDPNGILDTLKALQTVTIEGQVEDQNGQILSDFNGVIYPTLFDKAIQIKTLGNDPKSFVRNFRLQKNILAKGAASVENGKFTFTFTLPQDIVFEVGKGKLSYYAWDEDRRDAGGSFSNFIVFGVDENFKEDNTPPVVDVFMNSADWAFGGLTSDRPVLYAELSDDSGFNISGTSIGQDAIAILNEDTKETYILNDFYEPVLDDFRRGTIRYPLSQLAPGRYSIKVRAWDIFNNPGEGYTEFVVGKLEDGALAHVLNYPNPVTDMTRFRFEHNLAGQTLRVQIDIYDMQGRQAKSITQEFFADSNRSSDIIWDGLGGNGLPLASGIYVYKVTLEALDGMRKGQGAISSLEKLVLLK